MKPIMTWTEGVEVQPEAVQQLKDATQLPFIHHHVAAMPDVHWGIGDHCMEDSTQHDVPVEGRVVLAPTDRCHIFVEPIGAFGQPSEVGVGKINPPFLTLALSQFDEVPAHPVADPARTAVQHDPDEILLVQADLDEMVATAERTQLLLGRGLTCYQAAWDDVVAAAVCQDIHLTKDRNALLV